VKEPVTNLLQLLILQRTFSVHKTRLFWKNLLFIIFISREKKSMHGFKAVKYSFIFLLGQMLQATLN